MIRYRQATPADMAEVMNLIEAGFSIQGNLVSAQEGLEHRTLFSYLFSLPEWNPERLYLAESDSKIVATVGVFPKTLSFEGIAIPVWAISPVVTAPQFRGEGFARECLNQMMVSLIRQGVSAVFLWGLPAYYPKLGFVPIFPRYKTKLTFQAARFMNGSPESGNFRTCNLNDVKPLSDLYNSFQTRLWLQPYRSLEWWRQRIDELDIDQALIKEVPFPKKENFLIWENNLGKFSGYLNFSVDTRQRVFITEALSSDFENTFAMLQCYINHYLKEDQILFIRGTTYHPLNIAAFHMGGIHLCPAPLAGMVKVINWSKFLDLLYPLLLERLNPANLKLKWSGNLDDNVMSFHLDKSDKQNDNTKTGSFIQVQNRSTLTKMIFGLYDNYDLQFVQYNSLELLQIVFPKRQPFIWDTDYLY